MRVRLLVETTYHPDAGGARRQGEVFNLSDELAAHWIRNDIAEDATGAELTPPRVPLEETPEPWDIPSLDPDAPFQGAVVNSDDNRPPVSTRGMQARKQRRG